METLLAARIAAFCAALQFGHACLRVETGITQAEAAAKLGLQFGHACLRVETCVRLARVAVTFPASIRPRLLARGDIAGRAASCWRVSLQFGHACLRVETAKRLVNWAWGWMLQFGHACLRVLKLRYFPCNNIVFLGIFEFFRSRHRKKRRLRFTKCRISREKSHKNSATSKLARGDSFES